MFIPFILQVAYVLATDYSAHPWASPWRAVARDVQICSRQICRSPQSYSYLCFWGLTPLPPLSNSNYFGYILDVVRCLKQNGF
ncbi:hypothetical protein EBC73_14345 [Salmonella enterica subsp. enterica serovar Heidelberg]|nr:hypothetical protein [Salmonella enterica]EBZ4229093.1 hypothetical protein [Salmonella enterica subsp. enterica serovar Heidelberg]MMC24197.1 hypothetical protein [Salmonella enterica subsp. enterica serovar Montevideo]EAS6752296.1 hypothetical protein [Salmonella enterica]EAS6779147.1 hypothetical protein [Salmonella enterica]